MKLRQSTEHCRKQHIKTAITLLYVWTIKPKDKKRKNEEWRKNKTKIFIKSYIYSNIKHLSFWKECRFLIKVLSINSGFFPFFFTFLICLYWRRNGFLYRCIYCVCTYICTYIRMYKCRNVCISCSFKSKNLIKIVALMCKMLFEIN